MEAVEAVGSLAARALKRLNITALDAKGAFRPAGDVFLEFRLVARSGFSFEVDSYSGAVRGAIRGAGGKGVGKGTVGLWFVPAARKAFGCG